MSITKRQEEILTLLYENIYLSVEKLSELTFTSPSSIRRDLTKLQNMSLLKRTHGGAEIVDENNSVPPFNNRITKNNIAKKKIAKKASVLLCDGISIMLDGSSTSSFLIPFIAKNKNIKLFTNNMLTAINASNYGISTHCIGGEVLNSSAILCSEDSYHQVQNIHPDIFFFSSYGIDENGIITDPTQEENYLRFLMLSQSKTNIFLCDSGKFNRKSLYTLTTINDVDKDVFDEQFDGLHTTCEVL